MSLGDYEIENKMLASDNNVEIRMRGWWIDDPFMWM